MPKANASKATGLALAGGAEGGIGRAAGNNSEVWVEGTSSFLPAGGASVGVLMGRHG